MTLQFIFLTLFILIVLVYGIVVRFLYLEVRKREDALKEALWQRRHRIPLFIEVSKANSKEIIEIRSKLSNEAYSLQEQIVLEKDLSRALEKTFQAAETNPVLSKDTTFLSLKKELQAALATIRIAANDYDYAFSKFRRFCGFLPFFGKKSMVGTV